MAERGKGIDLLGDCPPGAYIATIVCRMAGVRIDDNSVVEEARLTIHGFYFRVDGEEFYVRGERVGKLLPFSRPFDEVSCEECGSLVPRHEVSGDFDTETVCITCADEIATFEEDKEPGETT